MSTYTDQLRKILEGLYTQTVNKRLQWRYEESTDCSEAPLGDGFVQVLGETDEDGDYATLVKILNKEKQVIDRIYGGSYGLAQTKPKSTGHADYWDLIRELKSSAERNALGTDRVIESMVDGLGAEDILNDLDSDVPF